MSQISISINSTVTVVYRKRKLPIIKTNRLVLRDIGLNDITADYIQWLNDPEVTKFLEIRFVPQTKSMVKEYIKRNLKEIETRKHFGVYDNNGSMLVGTVTLPNINWNHSYSDISFVIGHPKAQGKGYASEAVFGVVYYMFKECGLYKLWGGYYDEHIASKRVFEKNGFKVEGRLRKKLINYKNERVDHIIVGLLAEDFIKATS